MAVIDDVLADEPGTRAPAGMLEDVLARTRGERQARRRPWDALRPASGRGSRVPAATAIVVTLVILVAVGMRLLPRSGPSPTPSPAPALVTCATGGPLGGTADLLWVGCPGGVRAVDTTARPLVAGELVAGVGVPVTGPLGTWAVAAHGIVALDQTTGPGRQIDIPGVALLAEGETALWAGTTGRAVLRIDPAVGAVTGTVDLAAQPLALVEASGSVWVATDDGQLHAFSVDTLVPTGGPAAVGPDPALVAATASAVYVASRGAEGTVWRVDLESGAVTSAVVDATPDPLSPGALLAAEDAVWITRRSDIIRLDPVTLAAGTPDALPGVAAGLVRAGDQAWVLFADGRLDLVPLP